MMQNAYAHIIHAYYTYIYEIWIIMFLRNDI